jgi:hypothetical protein
MANFSNYLETKIVEWLYGVAMPTAPTTLYVALFSSDPTDANTGTEITSTITGAATRTAVANAAWTTTTATTTLDAKIQNNAEITITNNSTNSTNVNATHFGVFDSSTGSNNLLFHGQLASTVTITPGSNIKFAPNSITLTVQ